MADATPYTLFLNNKIGMPGRTNHCFGRTPFGTDGASGTKVHINEPAT